MGYEQNRSRHYAIAVRVFQVVCLIIVVACVASGSGYCITRVSGSQTIYACSTGDPKLGIKYWTGDENSDSTLRGQYFVFVSALLFLLISFGLIFLAVADYNYWAPIVLLCGLGAAITLIAGVVEAWYASGYGQVHTKDVSFYVRSWLAGSVFCFLAAIFYILDVLMAAKDNIRCPCTS